MHGLHLRYGGHCNPGACAKMLRLDGESFKALPSISSIRRDGSDQSSVQEGGSRSLEGGSRCYPLRGVTLAPICPPHTHACMSIAGSPGTSTSCSASVCLPVPSCRSLACRGPSAHSHDRFLTLCPSILVIVPPCRALPAQPLSCGITLRQATSAGTTKTSAHSAAGPRARCGPRWVR